MKIVIIGGDAAGMSAVVQVRRRRPRALPQLDDRLLSSDDHGRGKGDREDDQRHMGTLIILAIECHETRLGYVGGTFFHDRLLRMRLYRLGGNPR